MGDQARRRAEKRARREKRKAAGRIHRSEVEESVYAWYGITAGVLARAPYYKTLVSDLVFTQGMGYVVISRNLRDGRIAAGVFLIDAYCLGVKNALLMVTAPEFFAAKFEDEDSAFAMMEKTPAYGRKLVEDAVAYARALGFEPHKDIREAEMILGDIDPVECTETFAFGKDGKPFFISGPHDTPDRIRAIMGKLQARCGEDGFHLTAGVGDLGDLAFPDDDEDMEFEDEDTGDGSEPKEPIGPV